MKKKIYITGHRNPDLDSLCSAYAYAELKNKIDTDNQYIAVRCGQLSESIEKQLQIVGVEAPPYMKDVYTKVGDVLLEAGDKPEVSAPVYQLVKTYNIDNPSVTPLYENGKYAGLLSVDDITAWFLQDNANDNPEYDFTVENISTVLPGKLFYNGGKDSFRAPINVGAAAFQDFSEFIRRSSGSLIVMGARPEHIRYAIRYNVPAIIITTRAMDLEDLNTSKVLPAMNLSGPEGVNDKLIPEIDVSGYEGIIYITSVSSAEAIRRLRMSEPMGKLMRNREQAVQATDLFEDAKEQLTSSKARGLAVFDHEEFVGYVTRRCFLKRPEYHVIMMDHNEAGQSIRGIETAAIVEIVDHHRLDAMKTDLPIMIDARPVGSTCTIVWQHYLANGIEPGKESARMMLTGILSDTLILKSPTTTEIDKKAVTALSEICGLDYKEFGSQLYSVTSNLSLADPKTAVMSDFKIYEGNGAKVGIGQCETTTLQNADEYIDKFLDTLDLVRMQSGLDWAMVMVTDVLSEKSILLSTIYKNSEKLPYEKMMKLNPGEDAGTKACRVFDMPGVMSRKKQLLPAVLHALE